MEPDHPTLDDLLTAVVALEKWLSDSSVPHAYIGGLAVAFRGRERVTRDVDGILDLDLDDIDEFIQSGGPFGFSARQPGEGDFARTNLVIRMQHNPSGVEVDFSIGLTGLEQQAIATASATRSGEATFPVVAPEYLLVMKAFAKRPRDIADIEGILDRNPDVDLSVVRYWLNELGNAAEDPTIPEGFETILRQRQRQGMDNPPADH